MNDIADTAIVDSSITLGDNNKIEDFVVFRPSKVEGTTVGNDNVFKVRVTIGGETRIGDFCFFSPHSLVLRGMVDGSSRPVVIGDNVYIGAGAIILPGVTIVSDVIIGAGAVVTKDCGKPGTYVGVPAKLLEYEFRG